MEGFSSLQVFFFSLWGLMESTGAGSWGQARCEVEVRGVDTGRARPRSHDRFSVFVCFELL